MPVPEEPTVSPSVRVFISYAHDDAKHVDRVRRLCDFLRRHSIDARLDLPAAEQPQDWTGWFEEELRAAKFVLVIASPAYRRRAEDDAPASEGRGVKWEASRIRNELYRDRRAGLKRIFAVVLPGCSAHDIPSWLNPASTTYYTISSYSKKGADKLLRLLTGQPYETLSPLGPVPLLPPRAGRPLVVSATARRQDMLVLVRHLADRNRARNQAMVQADVRQLLLVGGLGLDEYDLGAESETWDELAI